MDLVTSPIWPTLGRDLYFRWMALFTFLTLYHTNKQDCWVFRLRNGALLER